jgi:hypothetical protein
VLLERPRAEHIRLRVQLEPYYAALTVRFSVLRLRGGGTQARGAFRLNVDEAAPVAAALAGVSA